MFWGQDFQCETCIPLSSYVGSSFSRQNGIALAPGVRTAFLHFGFLLQPHLGFLFAFFTTAPSQMGFDAPLKLFSVPLFPLTISALGVQSGECELFYTISPLICLEPMGNCNVLKILTLKQKLNWGNFLRKSHRKHLQAAILGKGCLRRELITSPILLLKRKKNEGRETFHSQWLCGSRNQDSDVSLFPHWKLGLRVWEK